MSICNTRKSTWISTYFSRPTFDWQGKEVVWVYDMIYELFPELLPNALDVIKTKKIAFDNADKIFCISNTTAKDLLRFYPNLERKISVIHLSHDPIFTYHQKPQPDEILTNPFILFVGKRGGYKNFKTLFSAYAAWDDKDIFKLVVVGEAWSLDEKKLITQHNLEDHIILYENIDDRKLCNLYNRAKAFAFPSLYEGFGIPLLEAMACGCPVVASRIPSTIEVAGDVPIYFKPGDTAGLEKALDTLCSEEDQQERINKGVQKASQYSWEKTAKLFYQGLKELYESN